MKNRLTITALAVTAAASFLTLSACADGPYYHHHDRMAMVDGDYDVYYDNAYGAFNDGYWGDDGFFYYRNAVGDNYRRDNARHIRRDAATGFNPMHVHHHYSR